MHHPLRLASIVSALSLIAACGPPAPAVSPVGNASGGAGCPAPSAVFPAEYQRAADEAADMYGGSTYGAPTTAHWQIPMKVEMLDWDNPPPNSAFGPRNQLDATAPAGDSAWIYTSDRAEPCQAKIAGYYFGRGNLGGPDYGIVAVQAEGCAPPQGEQQAMNWAVLGAEPTGCKIAQAENIGSRASSWDAGDAPAFPHGEVELPPASILAAIPPRACDKPGCQPLWSASQATTPDLEADDVTMTWVYPDGGDYCSWKEETHHGIYLGPPGGPLTLAPVKGTADMGEGELGLAGILHDGAGARLLLTQANGDYGVHAIEGGRLGAGRVATWYVGHEEDYSGFSMWNVCGL